METTTTDDMFEQNVRSTATVVRTAQKERGAKEGEVILTGSLLHYIVKVPVSGSRFGRNVESPIPPKEFEYRPKTKTAGDYIANIPLQVHLENLKLIPSIVEARDDGVAGWRVKFEVSRFKEAETFLKKHVASAWAEPLPMDPTSIRVRQFIDARGEFISHIWMNYRAGDSVRCTAPDGHDNVLRAPHPNCPGALLVQPSTQLQLNNVVPFVYLSVLGGNKGNNKKAKTAQEPTQDETAPPAPPATAATDLDVVVAEEKEESLFCQFSFVCKTNVIVHNDKELMALCPSERHWMSQNRNAHLLAPIDQVRDSRVVINSTCYFYVSPKYLSKWAPDQPHLLVGGQGVAILRDVKVDEKDFHRVVREKDVERHQYGMTLNFTVFQWLERPHTRERYIVRAGLKRDDDTVWRYMGITNGDAYAAIATTHTDVPLHATMKFWKNATLNHPHNDPALMNREEGTENIRGYYSFILDRIEPDYLRYFRTSGRGLRLSADYVRDEFEAWASVAKKTGALKLQLSPYKPEFQNPLHMSQGIGSAVISLGNGQPPPPHIKLASDSVGFNHGFAGDVSSLFTGRHDFYVLTSRVPTEDQFQMPFVDEWLRRCITESAANKTAFYYWIFAVDREAKLAPTPVPAIAAPTEPVPPAPLNADGKRGRDGEDVEYVEEEYVEEEVPE